MNQPFTMCTAASYMAVTQELRQRVLGLLFQTSLIFPPVPQRFSRTVIATQERLGLKVLADSLSQMVVTQVLILV